MKICKAVFSNNSQIEKAYSTLIVSSAKNLNRVALPVIDIAAFASVLSVASFDYNSCIAACWNLCSGPFYNMEMSLQEGSVHLKSIN